MWLFYALHVDMFIVTTTPQAIVIISLKDTYTIIKIGTCYVNKFDIIIISLNTLSGNPYR